MNNRYPLEVLEERIGYSFSDRSLLESALTHSSYANELIVNKRPDYERLEFLGDAVLELTVSDFLYRNYPNMKEGKMTSQRSSLVCESSLALCSKEINLSEFIFLGKGEDAHGSRYHDSIVSDVFEAIIGAIYLDSGLDAAKTFIHRFVISDMDKKKMFTDSKSILQNKVQKDNGTLEYKLIESSGPEHKRRYVCAVLINGESVAKGSGSSKKGAEQHAAYSALLAMNTKE